MARNNGHADPDRRDGLVPADAPAIGVVRAAWLGCRADAAAGGRDDRRSVDGAAGGLARWVSPGSSSPDHGTLDIRRGSLRPSTAMAMATTHTARTVHHTGSEDGPPAPGAGNVRTQRAICGTRLGAISTSTTAVPAAAPGSAVRVRATHAAVKPSSTLPASARPAAAQGSASPPMAAVSRTSAPAVSGASSATARSLVRRAGVVGVTSTTGLAGSSRVNAAAAASSAKQTGNSMVAAAGNAAAQPPATTATPVTPATAGQAPARSTGPVITW